jgi:hypothetical protein
VIRYYRVKEERNIQRTVIRRKANWIGHILLRNWLLKHVIQVKIQGRIEVTGRRGRRGKQVWRSRFVRIYGVVVTYCRMNVC